MGSGLRDGERDHRLPPPNPSSSSFPPPSSSSSFSSSSVVVFLVVVVLLLLCRRLPPLLSSYSSSSSSPFSISTNLEETHVPFLLDLQLSNNDEEVRFYMFESKAVRRMELLVLSTLGWRMNPATAISFIQCILSRVLKKGEGSQNAAVEDLRSCDSVLLSVLSDWRWVQFAPSVSGAAAILHSMEHHSDVMQQVLELLYVSKFETDEEVDSTSNSSYTTVGDGFIDADSAPLRQRLLVAANRLSVSANCQNGSEKGLGRGGGGGCGYKGGAHVVLLLHPHRRRPPLLSFSLSFPASLCSYLFLFFFFFSFG